MTDIVSSETRSRMMSGIKGKNTKPEKLIRSQLHMLGFRFRIHDKNLPGKPDIVLKKYNAVIFVHGCFWHRHQCHLFRWPKTRQDFWIAKINKNHANDTKIVKLLESSGWRVCIVWECATRGAKQNIAEIAKSIAMWLLDDKKSLVVSG